jgi:hypothetical protein
MGWNHLDSKFLYVTDGGHYENLGLVELIRRGCTMIYCFDASGDHIDSFKTLGEAVALARAEFNVEIDIRADAIAPRARHDYSPTDFVVGTLRYPRRAAESGDGEPTEQPSEAVEEDIEGLIVYAKAAVTEDAPWDVRAFMKSDRRFPSHSTVDQFFNEQKFEAYRALGAHTARRALRFYTSPVAAAGGKDKLKFPEKVTPHPAAVPTEAEHKQPA